MSLAALDPILKKEAVIATYPASYLKSDPTTVEQVYRTHSRTHIPLGDTTEYVESIIRWVGGGNKGAFIGAVVGDYGHGKTSFQVHLWDECTKRGVLAVPPFSWDRVSDILGGVAAWISHSLKDVDPKLQRRAESLFEQYRERSLIEVAEATARKTEQNVDDILRHLRDVREHGGAIVDTEVTPDRLLDYLAEISAVIKEAGFVGPLVLLDEPEVAAKRLTVATTAQILFELANGLLSRKGDYGVFVSIPENFLASIQKTFTSLLARLQMQKVFIRLRDLYNDQFAATLWRRFVVEFGLHELGDAVVSNEALRAIGQVSSSERRDLGYGPRTVISAFRRMVGLYRDNRTQYSPSQFAEDCASAEILVTPDFQTRLGGVIASLVDQPIARSVILSLAAFPQGISVSDAAGLGISADTLDQARSLRLVTKKGSLYMLTQLQHIGNEGGEADELEDSLKEILEEYAPRPSALQVCISAIHDHVLPRFMIQRQGQQLVGWDTPRKWTSRDGVAYGVFTGSFTDSASLYPRRTVGVSIGTAKAPVVLATFSTTEGQTLDLIISLSLRWNADTALPRSLQVHNLSSSSPDTPPVLEIGLDLIGDEIETNGAIERLNRGEALTPMGALYLIGEMGKRSLSRDYQAAWEALRETLLKALIARFLLNDGLREDARGITGQEPIGGAEALLGRVFIWVLNRRYPNYSTLLVQPHWTERIENYIRALKNQDIPHAAKRGQVLWSTSTDVAAKALGSSSKMNLGSWFAGYDNLITVKVTQRGDAEVFFRVHPLEQSLQDFICEVHQPKSIKVGDRETTWWRPLPEVLPTLMTQGYSLEECAKIVEIGRARGSFQIAPARGGGEYIYCLPFDVDQMRSQLLKKFSDLSAEITSLKNLFTFSPSIDLVATRKQIEDLSDERTFDSLVFLLNREFEHNHARLPGHIERMADDMRNLSQATEVQLKALRGSRVLMRLQSHPSGTSTWVADLIRYVVVNLVASTRDQERQLDDQLKAITKATDDLDKAKPLPPPEKIAQMTALTSVIESQRNDQRVASQRTSTLLGALNDYEHWANMLTQSDGLHSALTKLKIEGSHGQVADTFLEELQGIWSDISSHLSTRSIMGLGSHKQFSDRISELDDRHKRYVATVATAYNQEKAQLNALLDSLDIGDARCTEVFNPADVSGSKERLIAQAVGHVVRVIGDLKQALTAHDQEVRYASSVLGALQPADAHELVARIGCVQAELASLDSPGNAAMSDGLSSQAVTDHVRATIADARQAIREARKAIRTPAEVHDSLSESATLVYDLLPASAQDLKSLVLSMIGSGVDPSQVLDSALSAMCELFKSGRVTIKIERSGQ